MILHGGLRGAALPPLYQADRSFVGKLLIDDKEVDQLRIDAVRVCEAVVHDLGLLEKEPATLAHILGGPPMVMKLLTERVNFAGADKAEAAYQRLEKTLGSGGTVADPRCEFAGSTLSMDNIRLMVEDMRAVIRPYRELREKLKAGKW